MRATRPPTALDAATAMATTSVAAAVTADARSLRCRPCARRTISSDDGAVAER
jgi:hypothetical protein